MEAAPRLKSNLRMNDECPLRAIVRARGAYASGDTNAPGRTITCVITDRRMAANAVGGGSELVQIMLDLAFTRRIDHDQDHRYINRSSRSFRSGI